MIATSRLKMICILFLSFAIHFWYHYLGFYCFRLSLVLVGTKCFKFFLWLSEIEKTHNNQGLQFFCRAFELHAEFLYSFFCLIWFEKVTQGHLKSKRYIQNMQKIANCFFSKKRFLFQLLSQLLSPVFCFVLFAFLSQFLVFCERMSGSNSSLDSIIFSDAQTQLRLIPPFNPARHEEARCWTFPLTLITIKSRGQIVFDARIRNSFFFHFLSFFASVQFFFQF